jgi:large subunit ribosomal protein L18
MAKYSLQEMRKRRHVRLRQKVKGTTERPRLVVNRTNSHIHAQIIDDVQHKTLVAASTVQGAVGGKVEGGKGSRAAAQVVGAIIAERAKAAGIEAVVFDRNGNQYHGAVKEFADAAREAGLAF